MICTYFIVYNINGSDASSDNLQGLHHKTNHLTVDLLYENIQILNGILIIVTILLFESRKIKSNLKHYSYINLPDFCMNVCTISNK